MHLEKRWALLSSYSFIYLLENARESTHILVSLTRHVTYHITRIQSITQNQYSYIYINPQSLS